MKTSELTHEELRDLDAKDVLIFLNKWGKANAWRHRPSHRIAEVDCLWSVLTALRGPDDSKIDDEKQHTTTHIRECVRELAKDFAYVLGVLQEFTRPSEEYLLELRKKSEHFAQHARNAFDALEQMGFGPDGWSE